MRVIFKFEEQNVGENVGENIRLNKNQRKILAEISKDNRITQKEMGKVLNVSDRTVQRNTLILQEKGKIKRVS